MRNSRIPHASFTYEFSDDNILQIIDQDQGKTVTNDIDYVLSEISREENRPLAGCTVIYRDSMGFWDGVALTASGQFSNFYSVRETDVEKALQKVRGTIR
ncbi:hypothetical protein [Hymenobacter guriensis]|uniref:Uncharacterized protein n=1 Tax=Hymenobacter guriensis TaxID=2793065 RepID=A0ABS0L4N6_9BACT|nr:hypothetical protein [Hymenobacter guriensis]MBG8555101.1 hypothetical protein [Hymenobacter guriensis]